MSDKPKLPEWLANRKPRWYMMRPFKNRGYFHVVDRNLDPFDFHLDDGAVKVIQQWLPNFDPDRADIAGLEALMLTEFGLPPAHVQELTWPNMLAMLSHRNPPPIADHLSTPAKTPTQASASQVAGEIDQLIADAETWFKPRLRISVLGSPYPESWRREDEECEKARNNAVKAGNAIAMSLVRLGEVARPAFAAVNVLESCNTVQGQKDWSALKVELQEIAARLRVKEEAPPKTIGRTAGQAFIEAMSAEQRERLQKDLAGKAQELAGRVQEGSRAFEDWQDELAAGYERVAENIERIGQEIQPPNFIEAEPVNSLPESSRRKPGRKKLPPKDERKRLETLASWENARDAGVSRKDFCADEGITVKQFENFQRWKQQRENRGG